MTTPYFYTYVGVHGKSVIHRFVDHDGKQHITDEQIDFELFIKDSSPNSTHVSLYDDRLVRKTFPDIDSMRAFVGQYKDVMQIYGMDKPEYQAINKLYPQRPISFDFSKIKIVNIDIETEIGDNFPDPDQAEQAINSITCSLIGSTQSITWTTCDYKHELDEGANADSIIVLCDSEKDLSTRFLSWWNNTCPDAITGWSIEGFDIPYIINRMKKVVGSSVSMLSPLHDIVYRPIQHRPHPVSGKDSFKIAGLTILDYIEVFKKFNFSRPADYKLETIAQMTIGKGKTDYGEYANLKEFYQKNPTKFVRYNVNDVMIINEMEASLNYLLLAYTLAYEAKCNCQDIFGQVRFWDVYIYNFLAAKGIQIPPSKHMAKFDIEGAYVKPPKLGKIKWPVTFDLTSLNITGHIAAMQYWKLA